MKKIRIVFFSLCILITLVFTALVSFLVIEPKVYDFMLSNVTTQKLPFDNKKNVYGHDDVVLVMIDNKSIEKYRWPWKRDLHNKVFGYFRDYANPKVIIHDSIFVTLDLDNPEADRRYFNALTQTKNLIEGIMFDTADYNNKNAGIKYDKTFVHKFGLKDVESEIKLPSLYKSMLISPQEFLDSIKYNGSITMVPGFFDGDWSIALGDETYRSHEYLLNYKGSIFPSLAMRTFLLANNNPKITIKKHYFEFPDLNYKIKYLKTPYQLIVPTKFYKLYQTGYSHKNYSAVDIMNSFDYMKSGKKPIIDPKEFENKIIVYGANVSVGDGLNDIKKTSIAIDHPGADIQATAIDNIMHNDFLKIMPLWFNILIIFIGMFCIYYSIKAYNILKAINYSLLILAILLIFSIICYYYGVVVAVITPIIMCIYTVMVTYINRYVIEEKNKRKVTNALGKYMSEDVMKNVLQNIDELGLGGKKATVSVLFSDIRGFTSLSEALTAQEVSKLLNEYFSQMEPIVSKYNGIINKFIGDAIMAVFGEPIQDKNHAKNAVMCGYEMLEKVAILDEKWQAEGRAPIKIGIGINTGEVFIGNIGSEKRMEYTVIGDTVNLASRLESYNKIYNTQMLISSSTYEASHDIAVVNKISDVDIRGKSHKMDIYEVKQLNNTVNDQ